MRLTPSCQTFVPIDTARVSFVPVGPTLGKLELVGSDQVEVIGSWPGAMQLFNSGYSLFNPDLYKYTGPDGQVFVVDRTAGLKSLTDRAGNVLTMTPLGITSSHPQVTGSTLGIVFQRDAQGRITRITDPQGKSLVYAYDANGDLESVTDRETHTTSFGYLDEPAHHLERIEDPLGRTPIRNEYDPSGRLIAHVDAFNHRIEYTHDLLGRQEIVKDRTGAQRVLEYDERGNVVRETDPQGKVTVRTFDARNNREISLKGEGSVSRREIREALGVPDSTVRGWLQELVELEYLEAAASRGGAGKATRYRLTDRGPLAPGAAGLLTPRELAQLLGRPSKTREHAENPRSVAAGFFS